MHVRANAAAPVPRVVVAHVPPEPVGAAWRWLHVRFSSLALCCSPPLRPLADIGAVAGAFHRARAGVRPAAHRSSLAAARRRRAPQPAATTGATGHSLGSRDCGAAQRCVTVTEEIVRPARLMTICGCQYARHDRRPTKLMLCGRFRAAHCNNLLRHEGGCWTTSTAPNSVTI